MTIPTFAAVTLQNGVFQLELNLSPEEYQTAFDGSHDVWVEVSDETNHRVYPRQKFLAVPFALKVPVDDSTLAYGTDGRLKIKTVNTPAANKVLKVDGSGNLTWGDDATSGAGSVTNTDLGPDAVTTDKIANGTILGQDISPGTITDGLLAPITAAGKVADTALSAQVTKLGADISLTSEVSGVLPVGNLPVGTTAAHVAAGNDARFTDSRAPSGAAGGGLSGTYPNPVIATVNDTALSANVTKLGATIDLGTAEVSGILPIAAGGTGAGLAGQNFAFMGPATGGAGAPSFRALVAADYPRMNGATAVSAGLKGAVPQPVAGDEGKFLRGDATWAKPPAESVSSLDAPDGSPTQALVVDNAGYIGIGTTSPATKLDIVQGSAASNASGTAHRVTSTYSGAFDDGSSSFVYGQQNTVNLSGAVSGSTTPEAYGSETNVTATSNLSNSSTLLITGSQVLASSTGTVDATSAMSVIGTKVTAQGSLGTVGFNTKSAGEFYASGSADKNTGVYINAAGATENFGIYAIADKNYFAGNVGVGSTTPSSKLDVAGTITATGLKIPTSPANGYVLTSDGAGNATWQAGGSTSWNTPGAIGTTTPNTAAFTTATATTGVSIGTTSAGSDLFFGSGASRAISVQSRAAAGNSLTIQAGGTSGTNLNGGDLVMASGTANGTGTSNIQFQTASGGAPVTSMTILGNGNVGIGTTSPSQKLQVNGTIGVPYASGGFSITDATGASLLNSLTQNAGVTVLRNYEPNGFSLLNGAGTTLMAVDGSGKVGIGMTGPSYKLDVQAPDVRIDPGSGTATTTLRITGRSGGTAYPTTIAAEATGGLTFTPATGAGYNFRKGDASSAVAIDATGNVGIGTTSPGAPLEVASNSSKLLLGNVAVGWASLGFNSPMTTANHAMSGNGATTILNVPSGGQMEFRINNSTKMAMGPGGDFGIGTYAPTGSPGFDVQNAKTAASGVAYGTRLQQTLTASANSDVLTALYVNPAFVDASNTGVTHNGFKLLYIAAPPCAMVRKSSRRSVALIGSGAIIALCAQT